jgi:hypothetical protein
MLEVVAAGKGVAVCEEVVDTTLEAVFLGIGIGDEVGDGMVRQRPRHSRII